MYIKCYCINSIRGGSKTSTPSRKYETCSTWLKRVNKTPENIRCKINVSKIMQSDQYFLGILALIFHLFYLNFNFFGEVFIIM